MKHGRRASADRSNDPLLVDLLQAWRRTHDPALEDPIQVVGEAAARAAGPLSAKSKGALEAAWLELAKERNPQAVDRLLDTPWPGAFKTALERVRALAKFEPDPRIARKLAEIASTYTSSASHVLHYAIADVLARSPTASVLPALATVEERRNVADEDVGKHETAQIYAPVRRAIAALSPAPADPALLARALSSAPSKPRDAKQLFEEHTMDPGNLALRAVLADALQASGDPRGELIAIQLAMADGTATPAARKRQAQLLAAHADAWTGPLPNIPKASRRFERGFLVEANVNARGAALAGTFDRPEWVTLERLEIDGYGTDLRPLLRRLPLLRVLECVHQPVLEQLATDGPFSSVRAICSSDWLPNDRRAFPGLEVLGGTWMKYRYSEEAFAQHQAATRALGVRAVVHVDFDDAHLRGALQHRADGPAETRFTFGLWSGANRGFSAGCWKLRVERDAPRAEAGFSGGNETQRDRTLADMLKALAAAGIEEVVLFAGTAHLEAIDKIARGTKRLAVRVEKGETDLSA